MRWATEPAPEKRDGGSKPGALGKVLRKARTEVAEAASLLGLRACM